MLGRFEIKKAKDGEFYFHLKAPNGQVILASEMYERKASALNGVQSVKKNASDDKRYERKEAKNGHFMFNLKAANHEVIGTSQTYTSSKACDNGIASVMINAPKAQVLDETA